MKKSGSFGILGAALGLALPLALALSPAQAEAKTSPQKTAATLKQMAEAMDRGDCGTVVRLGGPLLDARGGSGLPSDLEAAAFEVLAYCESEKKLNDRAYAHALRGTALEESSDYLWRLRLAFESDSKRHDAAVATIEVMSQGRGAALNSIPINWMHSLDSALEDGGQPELRRRLLAVLASDAYDPDDTFVPADSFRLSYANLLVDAGDTDRARMLVAGLRNPGNLAKASLDPRVRAFLPREVDIRAAAEAELAVFTDAMARHPDRLDALVEAAANLRLLGRPRESLQLLQTAADRIDDPKAFVDRDEYLGWWWNAIGYSHAMLGQYVEAVAAFGKGSTIDEGGNLNVSQVLNLAAYQVSFGRGEEALKTLAVFDDPKRLVSPYGAMVLRFTRGCAHAVTGRPGDAAADLAFARAHEKDHPSGLSRLLLCLGDMDGAAAAIIRRLDDPKRRSEALLQLSDYDDPPVALPPDPVDSRLPALKARPDVKAAIERAGGTRRFRVQGSEL